MAPKTYRCVLGGVGCDTYRCVLGGVGRDVLERPLHILVLSELAREYA